MIPDAEFYVQLGCLEYVSKLSDRHLVRMTKEHRSLIVRTKKDRRYREDTRAERLSDLAKTYEALNNEVLRRFEKLRSPFKIHFQSFHRPRPHNLLIFPRVRP